MRISSLRAFAATLLLSASSLLAKEIKFQLSINLPEGTKIEAYCDPSHQDEKSHRAAHILKREGEYNVYQCSVHTSDNLTAEELAKVLVCIKQRPDPEFSDPLFFVESYAWFRLSDVQSKEVNIKRIEKTLED